jgi:hypothetical protein
VKQSLKKRLISERGATLNSRLYWSSIPATHPPSSGKSPGNPVVELATPNGTNNLTEGTNKNELRVRGKVEPCVG